MSEVGELVYSKESRTFGEVLKDLTHSWSNLIPHCKTGEFQPMARQGPGCLSPPQSSCPEPKPPPKSKWSFKHMWSLCPGDVPFLLTFISAARYAQAIAAGIMEMLSAQRHFVSNNIFILHPSLAGGEFFCLMKSHSSFGTKCSPVSWVSCWFYWRTVLQTKTMLYFSTLFELPLCHFPEEHDRPTTKLCFKILCPI